MLLLKICMTEFMNAIMKPTETSHHVIPQGVAYFPRLPFTVLMGHFLQTHRWFRLQPPAGFVLVWQSWPVDCWLSQALGLCGNKTQSLLNEQQLSMRIIVIPGDCYCVFAREKCWVILDNSISRQSYRTPKTCMTNFQSFPWTW